MTQLKEFDMRGRLAASLKCWHRLTGEESAELVALFAAQAAQAAGKSVSLKELGKRLAELLDEDQFVECEKLLLSIEVSAKAAQPAQSTAAIKTLEHLSYTYHGAEYWKPPLGKRPRFLDQDDQAAQQDLPDCWVVLENGKIIGTHDEPGHIKGNAAIRYVPAQPSHAHAIDTSPERVEKQAGDVQVPEGWKLVPVEPTQAMCKAGHGRWRDWSMHSDGSPWNMNGYKAIYKAMLSAAPSTKEGTI